MYFYEEKKSKIIKIFLWISMENYAFQCLKWEGQIGCLKSNTNVNQWLMLWQWLRKLHKMRRTNWLIKE